MNKDNVPIYLRESYSEIMIMHLMRCFIKLLPHRSQLARLISTRYCLRKRKYLFRPEELLPLVTKFKYIPSSLDILLLGSSHIYCGINPNMMDNKKTWNAAIPSGNYKEYLDIYKALRQSRKTVPKLIIVEENFWSCSLQLYLTPFVWE